MTPKFTDAFCLAPLIHLVLKGSRYRMANLLCHPNSMSDLFVIPVVPVACVARVQLAYQTHAYERLHHGTPCRFGLSPSYMGARVATIIYVVRINALHAALARVTRSLM